jgi:CubicO group peptidase (beta-lactamase class C family)
MAILKLMEKRKLPKIDDPLFNIYQNSYSRNNYIKNVVTTKVGLEDYLKFIDESDWIRGKPNHAGIYFNLYCQNKSKVIINKPGKIFDYSNTNYALLNYRANKQPTI